MLNRSFHFEISLRQKYCFTSNVYELAVILPYGHFSFFVDRLLVDGIMFVLDSQSLLNQI